MILLQNQMHVGYNNSLSIWSFSLVFICFLRKFIILIKV